MVEQEQPQVLLLRRWSAIASDEYRGRDLRAAPFQHHRFRETLNKSLSARATRGKTQIPFGNDK